MELSLHRLRMLHEFARCGTVTGAAAVLHYTPSAVSQQLAVLEREVGVELLEQVGRRVRLTEIGRVLARHAAEVLAAEERARIALEQAQRTVDADLTVGMPATLAGSLVPPTLALLARRYPGVRVKTREVVPEETAAAVRDGDLDLAFVLDYPGQAPASWAGGLEAALVGREQLYLVAPRGTRGAAGPVAMEDLAACSWVASETNTEFGRALRQMCRDAGFTPRIAHQVDGQSTAMAMVAAGLGVTLVADLGLTLRPDGVDVAPFGPPVLRRVLILRRAATRDRPAELAFVRAALDTAQSLGLEQDGEAAAPAAP
ncbi:LysR family transcriptional regulator [Streptomonospora wellingtoniae]|uniref:LysR substrate-binding domain-containing protein n=1 Tax=Streptomonospora wellingtoniae TaxID=3075544 RepID=A0ABU2KNB9_9ACTN|nr:LysR substrate-binding domain-containing protein [Streptomonospora sp. DSM 45055]MDT0300653.1 LysR substrate-binding domain-containing protein [Streptomonospora sp. DSM 45055]